MDTSENPMIGLDNVVIAELLSDVGGTTKPTYGPIIPLRGAVQASVNPNSSVETDYADNGAFFVSDNRANLEMSLEFTNIDPTTKAKMLGQKKVNGITVETSQDQAPYFALGFRVWIGGTDASGNKIYEYFWYAKGKFSVPESGGTTKGESIEFQHTSMTAQFVSTKYSPDGKGGIFGTHVRTDDPTANQAVLANWFNSPVLTAEVDLGAVSVTASLSGSVITLTGSKVGGSSFTFDANSIVIGESVIVADDDGNAVDATVQVSAAGVSPTITITCEDTPASVIVTSSVKDSNGVGVTPLVDTSL